MRISECILKMLREKAGYNISTGNGAERLRSDIETATGERLSLNTIKRLVGILDYESSPRPVTLNILADYLGFSSWEALDEFCRNGASGFDCNDNFIDLTLIEAGKTISFGWEPDRKISLEALGEGRFRITESANGKLAAGDLLEISHLGEGFPFVAKNVIRNNVSLGSYIAAKDTGIKNLTISD